MKQYTHDLQSYPNFEKREITKSYSGLERDNSKPRRGSFLNYFWTSSIHAVCFCNCYFNFNLRNPRKAYTVSAPQEEKQSKNLTSCGLDFGRFRSGKTTWKGNSAKSRDKNKLLEKGDENTIITCHWSTDKHKQLLLLQGNTHWEGRRCECQSSPWQQKLLVLPYVRPNLDLSIWSISTNLTLLFLGYWVSGV